MSICNCNDPVKNFGQPNCVGVLTRPTKFAFVYTTTNAGGSNAILSTDTVDDAYLSGKINNTDPSQRWFLTGEVNEVNDARAENNTFEIDGFQINTSKGVRTVAFTVVDGASPTLADAFESMACRDMSFFPFSVSGQIGGNGATSGELNPFRIKKKTMKVIYQPENKANETPPMIMVSFDLNENEKDGDIAFMDSGTGAGFIEVDILSYEGLVDVAFESPATNITTTGFTFDMNLLYGNVFSPDPAVGFLLADFSLAEISPTPGPIAITSITETNAGVSGIYDAVIPAATSGDVLELTFSKLGFEATSTLQITIP